MNSYLLKICPNEDIDLIEDIEEREEAQEQFEDEIETVYQYLKNHKINSVEWEQIDNNRFNIEISTYKDRFNKDIICSYMGDIEQLLEINDIAFPIIENYRSI